MDNNSKLPRALSPREVIDMEIETLPFDGEWCEAFGQPARTGVWLVWGNSGSGKTSFALQLARELTKYGKVAYNSLEQGVNLSMKQAIERCRLNEVKSGRFIFINEDIDDLSRRLMRQKSPHFVVVDSLQYAGLDYRTYKRFKEQHRNKLIIFVSHADGIQPDGRTAKKVMYDAEMKIFVEGYRAISKGRFISEVGAYHTVWSEGASRYWIGKDGEEA